MSNTEIQKTNILETHVRDRFREHEVVVKYWKVGPLASVVSDYKVLKINPGPNFGLWVYISIGSWRLFDDSSLEFVILASDEDDSYVERLAMTTYYHSLHRLGKGHTFPLGEAWVDGSQCEFCLVSLPYPLGSEFEICNLENEHVHFLWLLPITKNELKYKIVYGLDAFEERCEEKELKYWDNFRNSIV